MKHRQDDNALRLNDIKHAIGKLPRTHAPDVSVNHGITQRMFRRKRNGLTDCCNKC